MWGTDTVEIAILSPPHVKTQTNQSQTKPLSFSVFSHRDAFRVGNFTLPMENLFCLLPSRTDEQPGALPARRSERPTSRRPAFCPKDALSLSLSLSLSLCVSLRSSHDSCGVGTLRGRSEHGNVQVFFPYTREEAGCGVNTTTAAEAEAEAEATSSSLLCAAGRRFARNDARPQSERKEW